MHDAPRPRPTFVRRHLPEIFAASRVLLAVAGRSPRPLGHAVASAASLGLRRITRARCRANMELVFPQMGPAERERLFELHQRYMVRLRLEAARVLEGSAGEIERVTMLAGEAHLRDALAAGRGALVVGRHEGTWWHAPGVLAARGFDVRSVFNSFPIRAIEEYLVDRAARRGIALSVIDRDAADSMRRASRENAVFYATFDLAVRPGSAPRLPVGAASIPIERGCAILARRLRMPIVQVTCEQLPDARSSVALDPPEDPGSLRADDVCAGWARRLEDRLRVRPEQWWAWGFAELVQLTFHDSASNREAGAPAVPPARTSAALSAEAGSPLARHDGRHGAAPVHDDSVAQAGKLWRDAKACTASPSRHAAEPRACGRLHDPRS